MADAGDTADREVPLADAGIAAEIARAAARGRGSDRVPTLEQLLAAFGERRPTDEARRRVAAALAVAGVGVRPSVLDAPPGERVLLLPPGAKSPSRARAILGLVALAAILAAAAVAATIANQDSGDRASNALPPDTGTTPAPAVTPTTTTPPTTTTAPEVTTAATTPTTAATTPTTTTETTPSDSAAAAKRKRRAAARRRAADRRRAAARRLVVVRLDAPQPTFLCVEDGGGKQLFGGTLSGRRVFKGREIRLNVGLASTKVTVNGRPVPLPGSPAGLAITRRGGARPLPLGRRPCA